MKWKVGQRLWLVPTFRYEGDPREVVVASVGRKWATLEGLYPSRRIDNDGRVDGRGYSSPGRCYESREQYEAERDLAACWDDTVRRIGSRVPDGMTMDRVQQVRALVGLAPWSRP